MSAMGKFNHRYYEDFTSKPFESGKNKSEYQSKHFCSDEEHSKSIKQGKNEPRYDYSCKSNDEHFEQHEYKRKFKDETGTLYTGNYSNKKLKVVDQMEKNQYFSTVLTVIERGIDDEEEKDNLIRNLMEKTIDKEIMLSCQNAGSRCIEFILEDCKNPNDIIRFMKAFSEDMETAFTNMCAIRISQKLLCIALKMMKSPISDVEASADRKDTHLVGDEVQSTLMYWICEFGEYCCSEFDLILGHEYASYLLRTIIQVLGYCFVNKNIGQSKKSLPQKAQLPLKNFDFAALSKMETSNIPKRFLKLLKKIIKHVLGNPNIQDYFNGSAQSFFIQTLLLVTKQRYPKYAFRLVNHLSSNVFADVEDHSVPSALIQEYSSYTFEKICEVATEEQQHSIWTQMNQYLDYIVQHPIANFIVQRLFDMVQDKKIFEVMCDTTVVHFDKILESQRYGVWQSMAKACNRLNAQQALFMKTLMECLDCFEPEHRRIHFASLAVSLCKFGSLQKKNTIQLSPTDIKLHGSIILQEMLKFHKPIKLVTSIINMKSGELEILACHIQGCHIFTSFFESTSVGEKNRDKLIEKLQPVIVSIAENDNGSFTLSRIWFLSSLKQRCVVADVLSNNRETLIKKKCSLNLLKKCAIFHYKHNLEQWKQIQKRITKKKNFLKEIIGD